MNQVIGRCSICGGEVVGHVGAWWATIPPPPAKCSSCGAVEARGPVIPMVPARHPASAWKIHVQPGQDCGCLPGCVCNVAACPRRTNTTAVVERTTYSVSETPASVTPQVQR